MEEREIKILEMSKLIKELLSAKAIIRKSNYPPFDKKYKDMWLIQYGKLTPYADVVFSNYLSLLRDQWNQI